MANLFRRCLTVILLSAISLPSTVATAAGPGGLVKVDAITVIAGRLYVHVNTLENPDDCATNSYFIVAADDAGKDQALSLLLTAKVSNRPITVWLEGCSWAPWHASAPISSAITLTQYLLVIATAYDTNRQFCCLKDGRVAASSQLDAETDLVRLRSRLENVFIWVYAKHCRVDKAALGFGNKCKEP